MLDMENEVDTWQLLAKHDLLPSLSVTENYPFITALRLVIVVNSIVFFQILLTVCESVWKWRSKDAVRLVGLVHAGVCLFAPIYLNYTGHYNYNDDRLDLWCQPVSQFEYFISISTGFFIWDTGLCVFRGYELSYIVHALMCGMLYFTAMIAPLVHHLLVVYGLMEISTLFLNSYQLLYSFGFPRQASILQNIFGVVFLAVRFGMGSVCAYTYHRVFSLGNPDGKDISCYPPWLNRVFIASNVMYQVLNIYWAFLILSTGIRKLCGKKSENEHSKQH